MFLPYWTDVGVKRPPNWSSLLEDSFKKTTKKLTVINIIPSVSHVYTGTISFIYLTEGVNLVK